MTFEEFFTKKKIDLKALKAADEPLFEEFKAHYSAMGEKSFDHSKKFWFNKLRKSYHLTEEEAVIVKKAVQADKTETTTSAADTAAAKPAGFKPRFKAAPPVESGNQKEEPKAEPSAPIAATGFKPRFKPGITKNTETTDQTAIPTDLSSESPQETAKPTGFKPRFKAGATKTAEQAQSATSPTDDALKPSEATDNATSEAAKPMGFKPRFKAGVTKTESTDSAQATASSTADTSAKQATEPAPAAASALAGNDVTNPPAEQQQSDAITQEQAAANKPTGFKPRFKAGLTKIDKKEE